ncbi:hypothetical protein [Streptomyces collinus]
MSEHPSADDLETLALVGDADILAAEEKLWDALGLEGPQPEFLAALREYRRAVLDACGRHHHVTPVR